MLRSTPSITTPYTAKKQQSCPPPPTPNTHPRARAPKPLLQRFPLWCRRILMLCYACRICPIGCHVARNRQCGDTQRPNYWCGPTNDARLRPRATVLQLVRDYRQFRWSRLAVVWQSTDESDLYCADELAAMQVCEAIVCFVLNDTPARFLFFVFFAAITQYHTSFRVLFFQFANSSAGTVGVRALQPPPIRHRGERQRIACTRTHGLIGSKLPTPGLVLGEFWEPVTLRQKKTKNKLLYGEADAAGAGITIKGTSARLGLAMS